MSQERDHFNAYLEPEPWWHIPAGMLGFAALVGFALMADSHAEISTKDYETLQSWAEESPSDVTLYSVFLRDGKITHSEFSAIEKERDAARRERAIDTTLLAIHGPEFIEKKRGRP